MPAAAVLAAPNVSQNGEAIRFQVNLDEAARITLGLFTLTGEQIYGVQITGNRGLNSLVWDVKNNSGQPVASGLYIYVIRVDDGREATTFKGKLAVLH
jgi:hypothetical protein